MADQPPVRIERNGQITTITLDRPDKLNAFTPAMADAVRAVLAKPGDARCVVITGAGRAFCSGADLAGGGAAAASTPGEGAYETLTRSYNPLMLELARCPVPVIAAVNGAAAGVGCSLALAADFVIAGQSAYFLQAFVNIGLVPDGGVSWMLPRLIGKARAAEMLLLGERISAEKAADWGMIYKCVVDDALMGEANALAERLAAGPTLALGEMRRMIHSALESDYAAALEAEAKAQRRAADSADATEGIAAFLQKRPASFSGI